MSALTPLDPVTLGLCSQIDLDIEVERAAKNRPAIVPEDGTLLPASATENLDIDNTEEEFDADKVFAKLSSLKESHDDEDK